MEYVSQCGEDKWITENLKLPEKGFYVDIGCAEPCRISNSYFLRQLGWEGIHIDANPKYKELWAQHGLNMTVGILWTDSTVSFQWNHGNPDISKIAPNGEQMPAMKINDWLASNNVTKIDFLTIDIEGAEYDVLATMDWSKYQPEVILWEYETMGVQDKRLCDFLKAKGYKEVCRTTYNYVYVKDSTI